MSLSSFDRTFILLLAAGAAFCAGSMLSEVGWWAFVALMLGELAGFLCALICFLPSRRVVAP